MLDCRIKTMYASPMPGTHLQIMVNNFATLDAFLSVKKRSSTPYPILPQNVTWIIGG